MINLIKTLAKEEKTSLNELFNAVPNKKDDWEYLLKEIEQNKSKQLNTLESLSYTNKQFNDVLKAISTKKNTKSLTIQEHFKEQTKQIKNDSKEQSLALKSRFLDEQNQIKTKLLDLEDDYHKQYKIFKQQILKIETELEEQFLLLNDQLKENRTNYLNKVSSVYNEKDAEKERITSKFHEQIQDYHQKNKQRLTQNTLKLQEEEENLQAYNKFHEKDEVYAKQNFLKTITNLNAKIHLISNNYKKIEENLQSSFNLKNKELSSKLGEKKKEINLLINQVLINYEKQYQQIDSNLDSIRKEYHTKELSLKNKYNRKVTSININLHNESETIKSKLSTLNPLLIEEKKEISLLNNQISTLKKEANKQIKQAKKEYKKEHNKVTKAYFSIYELNLLKRSFAEVDKNSVTDLYKDLFSLEESYSNHLIEFTKTKNKIKNEILENYMQLEIVPLESQNQLANNIYNTELRLQNLENEYFHLKTSKSKQLANLKSELHKYNLNKTKDRVQFNYELELIISKLTNYLQMESEKNEFVYQNKSISLKRAAYKAKAQKKTLQVNSQIKLNKLLKNHKIDYANLLLNSGVKRKELKTNLITEKNNYLLNKETLIKRNSYNSLDHQLILEKLKNESSYLTEVIKTYNDFYTLLLKDQREIISVFLINTPVNSNIDDFEVFFKTTKTLLSSKENLIRTSVNELSVFLNTHLESIITDFFLPKLELYKNKIEKYYQEFSSDYLKEKSLLKSRFNENKETLLLLKDDIISTNTQIDYSNKTVIYAKNDIEDLLKSDNNNKNNKTIRDLNNHIQINKNYKEEQENRLQLVKANQKALKKEQNELKKLIRQINTKLKTESKNKDRLIKQINILILKQVNVSKKLINNINNLNEQLEKVNKINIEKIINLTSENLSIKKIKTELLKAINKINDFVGSIFLDLHLFKNTTFKKLNNLHIKYRKIEINILEKSHKRQENLYLKASSKTNLEIKKEEKKKKNQIKALKRKEEKQTNTLEKENQLALSHAEKLIKESKNAIPKYKEQYKEMQQAFLINQQELLLKEENTLKSKYKQSLKTNQKHIKDTNYNIKRINMDMEYDNRKFNAQSSYMLNKDRLQRKKIINKQTNQKDYHNNQIYNLKRRIPKIGLEVRYVNARRKINENKILRKINKSTTKIGKLEKLFLKVDVWNKTLQVKNEFKKKIKNL